MAYDARAIEVMIASPSDVVRERQIVRDVIAEWNAIHSRREGICLMPLGWDTHASPELSKSPQDLINERILKHADVLVGIFWTRVGSPTGKSISGSLEEIQEHRQAGKPAMLYFSTAPVVPTNLDHAQLQELEKFKTWAASQGLIETFEDPADFTSKFRAQLQIMLRDNDHLRKSDVGLGPSFVEIFQHTLDAPSAMSSDAAELLSAAASDPHGHIMVLNHLGGSSISAGGNEFAKEDDRRSVARWLAAVEELQNAGLTRDISGKGEIFELTHNGYEAADKLK